MNEPNPSGGEAPLTDPTEPGKYPAEEGTWELYSPSGKCYSGTNPIQCVGKEQKERIPPAVALARIFAGIEEATPSEQREDAGFLNLHAAGLTYNDTIAEARAKHRLREIAMRIETGYYAPPPARVPSTQPAGWKVLKDTTQDERSWPEDYADENGQYFNTCHNCLRVFLGYKRRGTCKVCAKEKT